MNRIGIFTLNRILGDDRVSFSKTITQYLPEELNEEEKASYEKGTLITPETSKDYPIFETIAEKIKEEGFWSEWMQTWTSATIYILYKGEESINV